MDNVSFTILEINLFSQFITFITFWWFKVHWIYLIVSSSLFCWPKSRWDLPIGLFYTVSLHCTVILALEISMLSLKMMTHYIVLSPAQTLWTYSHGPRLHQPCLYGPAYIWRLLQASHLFPIRFNKRFHWRISLSLRSTNDMHFVKIHLPISISLNFDCQGLSHFTKINY